MALCDVFHDDQHVYYDRNILVKVLDYKYPSNGHNLYHFSNEMVTFDGLHLIILEQVLHVHLQQHYGIDSEKETNLMDVQAKLDGFKVDAKKA